MVNSIEAMKQALEALEWEEAFTAYPSRFLKNNISNLRQAIEQAEQAQPVCPKCKGLGYYDEGHECDDGSMAGGNYVECEKCRKPNFTKHEVENTYDWSDWVCPDPKGYLMECCDCGLVHEAEFKVVRYKSETEREECDEIDDPNVQAVFRMRRNEQWSPKDMAHRAGGLPIEQADQAQPVAWMHTKLEGVVVPHRPADLDRHPDRWEGLHKTPPPCPTCEALARTVMMDQTAHDTPPRKPLTDEEIWKDDGIMSANSGYGATFETLRELVRAIEAAHGITGEQK